LYFTVEKIFGFLDSKRNCWIFFFTSDKRNKYNSLIFARTSWDLLWKVEKDAIADETLISTKADGCAAKSEDEDSDAEHHDLLEKYVAESDNSSDTRESSQDHFPEIKDNNQLSGR